MISEPGRARAVVIGGSLAGILAARALAPHFETVTVVERDHYPNGPERRAGVPQARHVHTLLMGGYRAIEELLPGFDSTLGAAGAPRIDWPRDCLVDSQYGRWPRYSSDMLSRFASRELIEHVVRQLALKHSPSIRVIEGVEVVGLIAAPGGVGGVRIRRRGTGALEDTEEEMAELVVDASGRDSKNIPWLEQLGYGPPPETVVDPHVGYASRYYKPSATQPRDWLMLLVRNRVPGTRAGGIYTVEGGRWMVTLGGFAGDYPDQDDTGFANWARSLDVPEFTSALESAEPLTPIVGYRRTVNVWRHFERSARWPRGFVAIGDAVCAFNPVYAQGMSVAAIEARLLGVTFARRGSRAVERGFQIELARLLHGPWDLATQEDYRYPQTDGPPRSRWAAIRDRYAEQILRAVVTDRAVHRAFIDVVHMRRSSASLGRPDLALRVLSASRS